MADKTHLHHILIKGGLPRRQALIILAVYGVAYALIGIALNQAPEHISLLCFLVLLGSHLHAFRYACRASKQIKRLVVITKGVSRKLLAKVA